MNVERHQENSANGDKRKNYVENKRVVKNGDHQSRLINAATSKKIQKQQQPAILWRLRQRAATKRSDYFALFAGAVCVWV